jgi:hypothetical protein
MRPELAELTTAWTVTAIKGDSTQVDMAAGSETNLRTLD